MMMLLMPNANVYMLLLLHNKGNNAESLSHSQRSAESTLHISRQDGPAAKMCIVVHQD